MIYALGAGAVVGQLLDGAWRSTVLPGAMVVSVVALLAGVAGSRWRAVGLGSAAFALALIGGALLAARVEQRPADPAHIAAMSLPWRGELVGVVRGEPMRRARG